VTLCLPAFAAVVGLVVAAGCNAMWGIDELEYGADRAGGAASAGSTSGGFGGGSTTSGSSTATASHAGGWAGAGGSGNVAGHGGGHLCTEPCDDPPNDTCYEPSGTCDPATGECTYEPLPDGTQCAATDCGSYGSCTWSGECSNSGTRYRTCTDYECASGTCSPSSRQESDGCSRTVSNGTPCSAGYCCSNACVARNSNGNCGSCGIDCGASSCVGIVSQPGQYSCTCATNSFCRNAGFGADSTCWHDGIQSVCNCQCVSGSPCSGQCAGGGICSAVPGHNYCHY
jgi:hypothetical protein